MSEVKHTEGPMFVHDFSELGGGVEISCDHPASITVATMGNALTATHAEKLANAQRFARAVNAHDDLLDACTAMLTTWGSDDEDAIIRAREMACAAVLKATNTKEAR